MLWVLPKAGQQSETTCFPSSWSRLGLTITPQQVLCVSRKQLPFVGQYDVNLKLSVKVISVSTGEESYLGIDSSVPQHILVAEDSYIEVLGETGPVRWWTFPLEVLEPSIDGLRSCPECGKP